MKKEVALSDSMGKRLQGSKNGSKEATPLAQAGDKSHGMINESRSDKRSELLSIKIFSR